LTWLAQFARNAFLSVEVEIIDLTSGRALHGSVIGLFYRIFSRPTGSFPTGSIGKETFKGVLLMANGTAGDRPGILSKRAPLTFF
jgi:hypothetical protein